jgi:hypothetical protein
MASPTFDPKELKLFYIPKDTLRMTVGEDRSYTLIKPAWASPLTYPERYLALMNAKGEEIVTLADPNELSSDSLVAVREELRRRYLSSTVKLIQQARTEFGATYWHVVTERGEKDFVTQSLQENAQWLSPTHLLLIDVDGNRFEIPNTQILDQRSRELLAAVV